MKKKIATILLLSLTAMTLMLTGCGSNEVDKVDKVDNVEKVEKVTPTFMYFVSNSDADFDKTNVMIEELKGEYGNDIKFDIVNIDESPEAAENFQLVVGNTPALIMLNTSNDISAMEFKCADKEKLSADIEAALDN